MMFDMNMLFSYKQTLSESAESEHGYDRLLNGDDLQRFMTLNVFINEATGGTIQVKLQTSVDGTTGWTDIYTSPVTPIAVGKIVSTPLPRGMKRYLRLYYSLGGTSAGATVTAGITDAEESDIPLNAQKRDVETGIIPDLAAKTDALNNA